jgi:hypothetical protein
VSIAIGIFSAVKGVAAIVGPIIAASLHKSVSLSPGLGVPSEGGNGTVTSIGGSGAIHYGAFGFASVQYFVGSMAVATALAGVALLAVGGTQRRANA